MESAKKPSIERSISDNFTLSTSNKSGNTSLPGSQPRIWQPTVYAEWKPKATGNPTNFSLNRVGTSAPQSERDATGPNAIIGHQEDAASKEDNRSKPSSNADPRELVPSRPAKRNTSSPDEIATKIPSIAKHRFLLSIAKYPGLIEVICGAFMLWGQNAEDVSDSQEALSIISIICGSYTFFCWIYGQINHHRTYQDIRNHSIAKIVQTFGILMLSTGNICVVLLVIKELIDLNGNDETTTTSMLVSTTANSEVHNNIVVITDRNIMLTTGLVLGTTNSTGFDMMVVSIVILCCSIANFILSLGQMFFSVSAARALKQCYGGGGTVSREASVPLEYLPSGSISS